MKSSCMFVVMLALISLLSACGSTASLAAGAHDQPPDKLHARVFGFGPGQQPMQDATINNAIVVQKLLGIIRALPPQPKEQACTMQAGPHYELTFLAGSKAVMTVSVDASGCGYVKLSQTDVRQPNSHFWSLLDDAIADGAAQGKFDQLAIVHHIASSQQPMSAMITSTAKIEQLYTAINALSEASPAQVCQDDLPVNYTLAFMKGAKATLIRFSQDCHLVTLYRSAEVQLAASQAFWNQFAQILTGVTFGSAQPDNMNMTIYPAKGDANAGVEYLSLVQHDLMLKLYNTIYKLQPLKSGEDCLVTDVRRQEMEFTWSSIELLHVQATRLGCETGAVAAVGTFSRMQWHANPDFWNLVQQVEKA